MRFNERLCLNGHVVTDEALERLSERGVRVKDPKRGLVDFPALRAGREAFEAAQAGGPAMRSMGQLTQALADVRQDIDGLIQRSQAKAIREIFVTHPFASLSMLGGDRSYDCQYVGTLPTAKGYGDLPLYSLRRRPVIR